ncbi:MAG: DUF2442 domain-containing protein [Planctomycetota bacterium]|nr:DUF2442 domain-containing protein [Planctomycetota bacterium]
MLEVTAAHYVDQFRIRVRFNSGEEGVVDLADTLWGPMFEPLQDPAVFRRFEVSEVLHTVKWENDADLAPEFLYQKMVEQSCAPKSAATPFPDGK